MEISKINVNGTAYDLKDSRVNATDIAALLDAANYVPSAASGGTTYSAGTGIDISNDTISVDNTVITTSNIAAQIASNKPSYDYSEVGYDTSVRTSISGAVTIDPTIPVHHLTLSGNVSSVVFTSGKIMEDGHSCHVIFYSTAARTVAVNSAATMSTVDSTTYASVCPDNKALSLSLSVNTTSSTTQGYVEVDFLRIGDKIYVRGV